MAYKISIDRSKCIGCQACATLCSDNWKIDDDGKASPIKTDVKEIGCNQKAADGCPVKIIHVKEV